MKATNSTYSEYILHNVRQNLGLESDDASMDSEINRMSKREVLSRCLEWDGIVGYDYRILKFVSEIFDVDLLN